MTIEQLTAKLQQFDPKVEIGIYRTFVYSDRNGEILEIEADYYPIQGIAEYPSASDKLGIEYIQEIPD